ncbi:MAG TPA: DUF4238 domain-containing protein [Bacilli bacterium]|nr:DUF4238 domain-containing protein [Bacilli bacterium]
MAKNHYVSQLIIKRFSEMNDRINIFDVVRKTVLENKKSVNIFCRYDIYSDYVEQQLSRVLETPFAQLLDKKIIDKDRIIITRSELMLIKKFLLLESIRTLGSDGYLKIITGFSQTVRNYWSVMEKVRQEMPDYLPYQTDISESSEEAFDRALRVFIETDNTIQILMHRDATRELYIWAKSFFDGYIAFWDANNEQEFVLTDNGLTTEYEPSHIVFEGLSQSKSSYLLSMIKTAKSNKAKAVYADLFEKITIMYENFSIFNLSSKRSIVVINPFFRLFSKQGFTINNLNNVIKLNKPDIWPSFVSSNSVVVFPNTIYKNSGSYSMDDIFEYEPVKLSYLDTIYINNLFLSQTSKLLGFVTFEKIKDSLYAFLTMRMHDHKDVYGDNYIENLTNLTQHMINDDFNYIWKHFKEKENLKPNYNPYDFLDHYAKQCINDTRNNRYALEYLLSNEDKVRKMSNFSFMGSPNERIKLIKRDLNRVKNKKKKYIR